MCVGWHSSSIQNELKLRDQGRIQGGGGVLGVRNPPFWGTPKLHKEGKNVACGNAAF